MTMFRAVPAVSAGETSSADTINGIIDNQKFLYAQIGSSSPGGGTYPNGSVLIGSSDGTPVALALQTGDLITGDGTDVVRFARGVAGTYLTTKNNTLTYVPNLSYTRLRAAALLWGGL